MSSGCWSDIMAPQLESLAGWSLVTQHQAATVHPHKTVALCLHFDSCGINGVVHQRQYLPPTSIAS